MAYAEGSRWDAFEAVDSCYIGGPHEIATQDDGAVDDLDPQHVLAIDLVFGCQTLVTGLFKTQLADGIMGMDTRREAFWYQMFAAGKMGSEKQFSLCFSRAPTAERKGTEAGALTLGGVDERFDTSPMVYTPDATGGRDGFFSVRVRRMYLRDGTYGESAKSNQPNPSMGIKALNIPESTLNAGGIIVDSGTTDTYWNRGISVEFNRVFAQVSGRGHNNDPISLTHDELMALPTILFQLASSAEANTGIDAYKTAGLTGSLDPTHPNDVILAFPPSHYMEYDPDNRVYTSRFYVTEGSGSVLGANAIMGHNVLFDSDNNRIGWAESDCDYTKLVTENGYDFSITGNLQAPPPVTTPVASAPSVDPTVAPQIPYVAPSEPPIEPPMATPTPTPPEPLVATPVAEPSTSTKQTDGMKQNALKFLQDCDTTVCRLPVFAGSLVFMFLSLCSCYRMCCCFCRPCCMRKDYTYNNAANDELELSTFRDEPIDGLYNDDENDDDNSDGEAPETEFEGDFA
jgi:hypothetical protein